MGYLNFKNTNSKLLNLGLVLTSLIGYLEWGGGNGTFIFQGEAMVIRKIFTDPISILHPFIIVPLIGQLLLLATIFQKAPSRKLTYIGFGCIGILLGFIFLIGLIDLQYKLFFSTLPFFIVGFVAIKHVRKRPKNLIG